MSKKVLSRHFVPVLLVNFMSCATPVMSQQVFVPDDQLVSDPNSTLTDLSINQATSSFNWQDAKGKIWVGRFDKVTGDLRPTNGQGELVDTGATPVIAPDWVETAKGPRLVYTKGPTNATYLVQAVRVQGIWQPEALIDGDDKKVPLGSDTLNDTSRQPQVG